MRGFLLAIAVLPSVAQTTLPSFTQKDIDAAYKKGFQAGECHRYCRNEAEDYGFIDKNGKCGCVRFPDQESVKEKKLKLTSRRVNVTLNSPAPPERFLPYVRYSVEDLVGDSEE